MCTFNSACGIRISIVEFFSDTRTRGALVIRVQAAVEGTDSAARFALPVQGTDFQAQLDTFCLLKEAQKKSPHQKC
jgi:hypothetical protein